MNTYTYFLIKDAECGSRQLFPKKTTDRKDFESLSYSQTEFGKEHEQFADANIDDRQFDTVEEALSFVLNYFDLPEDAIKYWYFDKRDGVFRLYIHFDKDNNLIDKNSTDIIQKWNKGLKKLYSCDVYADIVKIIQSRDFSDYSNSITESKKDEEWLKSYGW